MTGLQDKLATYIDELKVIAADDDISSESAIALKATELRYMLKGRLSELEENEKCAQ